MKQRAPSRSSCEHEPDYQPIEMPRNSPTGFVCAFFATVDGLRADLAHLVDGRSSGFIGAFATFVVFAWRDHDEYEIPADEVARDRSRQPSPRGASSSAPREAR